MHLSRWHGLELPEFSPLSVAISKKDLAFHAASGEPSFVRGLKLPYLRVHGARRLSTLLRVADDEFSRLATLTNAQVVGHRWGLCHVPQDAECNTRLLLREQHLKYRLPTNKIVVAEVDTLASPVAVDYTDLETIGMVQKGILSYTHGTSRRGLRLSDIASRQFAVGRLAQDDIYTPERIWVLDIDPLIQRNHL